MRLSGRKIGLVVTGSHCTFSALMPEVEKIIQEGAEVYPIVSATVANSDTRFGSAAHWLQELTRMTGHQPISSIIEAEPIGPGKLFDLVLIAPCTGNTLAKLANGITDTAALMATKAHLRNQRPVVIAISTNDGLGMNAKNIGMLLNIKYIYWVPFGQDNPVTKSNSLVAKMDKIVDSVVEALQGRQIQPLLVEYQQTS